MRVGGRGYLYSLYDRVKSRPLKHGADLFMSGIHADGLPAKRALPFLRSTAGPSAMAEVSRA